MFPLGGTLCIPTFTEVSRDTVARAQILWRCSGNTASCCSGTVSPAVTCFSLLSGNLQDADGCQQASDCFPFYFVWQKNKEVRGRGAGREGGPLQGNLQTGVRSPHGIWLSRRLHSADASGHPLPAQPATGVMLQSYQEQDPPPDMLRSGGRSSASVVSVGFFFLTS